MTFVFDVSMVMMMLLVLLSATLWSTSVTLLVSWGFGLVTVKVIWGKVGSQRGVLGYFEVFVGEE